MKRRNPCPYRLALLGLSTLFLALNAALANADDLTTIKQRGTLVVGVKADYPPFGFRSPSGEIAGIEPELAAGVAKSLGVTLELVPVTAANRIQLLQQGKIDLIIATMNATLERRYAVDMIKPAYYAAGYNIMVPKSLHLASWKELKGKPVCGVRDAYYNDVVRVRFELQLITFEDTTQALAAMTQGRCIGMLYDDAAIQGELLQPAWADYAMPLESQEVQPWAIAVRKDQPAWEAYMSSVVTRWAKDGTILDLESKYHIKHSSFAEEAHQKAISSSN